VTKPGKGLSNMYARAEALHGTLTQNSAKGQGNVVLLWLPYERTH